MRAGRVRAAACWRLGACLVAGCGGGAAGGPLVVSVSLDRKAPDFGAVRIEGLALRALARALEHPGRQVRVVAGHAPAADLPNVAGEWYEQSGQLVFRPRIAPAPGTTLWVTVDTAGLTERKAGPDPLIRRFDVPPAPGSRRATTLLAIHPAVDTVPENLLRFYLEFSAPMRPGQALAQVRLLDDRGVEVAGAFLDTSEELWDPGGRRLTLLFDPGRVKRGIRTNLESGRPLVAGRRYVLRVDAGWRDAAGRPLRAGADKRMVAIAADHVGPDPARWTLALPAAGSTQPLRIGFDEPLDHALASRLLAVLDLHGRPVSGEAAVDTPARAWRFVPARPWAAGRYRIQVSPELEDLAGNRPGRAFDTDLEGAAPPRPVLAREFTVR